jgi:hypothetical protein
MQSRYTPILDTHCVRPDHIMHAVQAHGDAAPAWEGPAPPKHLQRKISKKVNFLDKVSQAWLGCL